MSPETGEHLMLWTVRASVFCYVIALWRWLGHRGSSRLAIDIAGSTADRLYPVSWFAAWLLCLLHVICAFHFRHHWDHAAAIEHTAAMTERVVGLRWGGGLYVNYIFLSLWGLSAVRSLWSSGLRPADGQRLERSLHVFAAFMMFNATAVFGPAWWWIPAIAVIAATLYQRSTVRRLSTEN